MRLNFPDAWLDGRRSSELHEGREVSNNRWVNKAAHHRRHGLVAVSCWCRLPFGTRVVLYVTDGSHWMFFRLSLATP